jgi:hypothetical protein
MVMMCLNLFMGEGNEKSALLHQVLLPAGYFIGLIFSRTFMVAFSLKNRKGSKCSSRAVCEVLSFW